MLAGLTAGLYLAGIGSYPPGLYDDEASVGYNAWTIAHYGTDQFGNHLPLFFVDFGDYKGPVATYLAAPFALLPLGATVAVRLPSALAGIASVVIAARMALRLTGSKPAAVVTMAAAALTPWVFLQSHTDMEGNILMVLGLTAACWCIVETRSAERAAGWWLAAGVALAVSVFTYAPARLLVVLVAGVALVTHRKRVRLLLPFVAPLLAGYAILGAWSLSHPGALLARFEQVGVFSGGRSPLAVVGRIAGNYLSYFGPDFLVVKGDGNARQTTGFGGVLLSLTLPLIVLGALRLWARRGDPLARFILIGTLVAPIPAALTLSAPHALRGAGLIPFLVLLMAEGTACLWSALRSRHMFAVGASMLLVASSTPYFVDYFTSYPARAATAFDAGEGAALRAAYNAATAAHAELFLSASLNQPLIQLLYAIRAAPPQQDFVRETRITVVVDRRQLRAVTRGDVLVLGVNDRPPSGATLMLLVRGGNLVHAPASGSPQDLLRVYRA